MNEPYNRMTQSDYPPGDSDIAEWVGSKAHQFWKQINGLIEKNYPDMFSPEWLYGGKKHGWSLRYKRNKSFCTLIPERNRFALLIIFGAEERAKVEEIRDNLTARIRKAYDDATTYHDGKWVLLTIDSDDVVEDVMSLLSVKRKPRNAGKS